MTPEMIAEILETVMILAFGFFLAAFHLQICKVQNR